MYIYIILCIRSYSRAVKKNHLTIITEMILYIQI